MYNVTISAKLRAFQYRFLHRIIFTNSRLFISEIKDSAVCSLCNEEEETLIHYFYECEVTHQFWRQVLQWIKEQCSIEVNFSKIEILFGFETSGLAFWWFLFLIAKYYLFLCRDKEWPNLGNFKHMVQEIKSIEYNIAIKNEKLNKHQKKWKHLDTRKFDK